jgi:hypothetical protein
MLFGRAYSGVLVWMIVWLKGRRAACVLACSLNDGGETEGEKNRRRGGW